MRKIYWGICLLFLTSSCLEWNKRNYSSIVTSLTSTLDSISTDAKATFVINMDSLKLIRCGLLEQYKQTLTPDTITIEAAQQIENLKFSCFNIRYFLQKESLLKTIEIKRKELKKLQQMIAKGDGERAFYNQMIQEEKKNVHNLKINYAHLRSHYLEGTRNFEKSERFLRELMLQ